MEDMRFAKTSLIIILTVFIAMACGNSSAPATPIETLKAYSIAVKKKDVAMMKTLLSSESIKLHEQEAKVQNVSVDEIIQRDTLFPPDQRVFDYRSEKIEGDKATVEVKNNFDGWDVIYLVKEDGIWKIDKKGTSDQIIDQNEADEKALDDLINQGREDVNQETNSNESTDSNTNTNQDLNQDSTNPPVNDPNNPTPLPGDPNNPDIPQDNNPANPKTQPQG